MPWAGEGLSWRILCFRANWGENVYVSVGVHVWMCWCVTMNCVYLCVVCMLFKSACILQENVWACCDVYEYYMWVACLNMWLGVWVGGMWACACWYMCELVCFCECTMWCMCFYESNVWVWVYLWVWIYVRVFWKCAFLRICDSMFWKYTSPLACQCFWKCAFECT